jgi:predicted DNA-binding protein YlxM (UPF0122 family)
MEGLIGYTGFVGSNIAKQKEFDFYYNSKNIEEIEGKEFDLLVVAGARGTKWKANKFPEDDFKEINKLIHYIDSSIVKKIVLISTIAVYDNPADNPYGRNRLYLETYLQNKYPSVMVVRLPSLFGGGIKKNAIYDMINHEYKYLPSLDSKLQYYCLDNIWGDIEIILKNNISVMNISPEPVPFSDVFRLFGENIADYEPSYEMQENMKTKNAEFWDKDGSYTHSSAETISALKKFLKDYHRGENR